MDMSTAYPRYWDLTYLVEYNESGVVYKLCKAEKGGVGSKIPMFPYKGEGGIFGMPYVYVRFHPK